MKRINGNSLCVHHINGNHQDDRLENRLVLTFSEHTRLHIAQGDYDEFVYSGKRLRKVPPQDGLSWCSGCQKFLAKEKFRKDRNTWNGLDRFCKDCRKPYDCKHNRKK